MYQNLSHPLAGLGQSSQTYIPEFPTAFKWWIGIGIAGFILANLIKDKPRKQQALYNKLKSQQSARKSIAERGDKMSPEVLKVYKKISGEPNKLTMEDFKGIKKARIYRRLRGKK